MLIFTVTRCFVKRQALQNVKWVVRNELATTFLEHSWNLMQTSVISSDIVVYKYLKTWARFPLVFYKNPSLDCLCFPRDLHCRRQNKKRGKRVKTPWMWHSQVETQITLYNISSYNDVQTIADDQVKRAGRGSKLHKRSRWRDGTLCSVQFSRNNCESRI